MVHFKHRVKRLEQISFETAYKDILANLLLIPSHRPEERRLLVSYSSLISLNPFFTSENVREFIRNRLAQTLIGTFNDETRKKFVDQFNSYMYDMNEKSLPWVFFDVILDGNFTELDVNLAGPGGFVDLNIIPTAALHSPHLASLTLDFEALERKSSTGKIANIFQSLGRLKNLTSLTLKSLEITHKESLIYLGSAVPSLKHLSFIETRIGQEDLLNLLLGENISKLKEQNIKEDVYHQYQIPSTWITPFCNTLESLNLEVTDEKKKLVNFSEFAALPPSVVACCIRHMPVLKEIFTSGFSVSLAVKMLHKNARPCSAEQPSPEEPIKMDEVYEEISTIDDKSKPIISATGILPLRVLDFVNIRNEDMVRAVGATCPFLERIVLVDSISIGEAIPVSDLTSYISTHWPKIQHLTFSRIAPEYRKAVIQVLGKDLLSLTLAGCEKVNPLEFLSCSRLESLKIVLSSTLDPSAQVPPVSSFNPEEFLPSMKTLESDTCLGEFSALIQEKASLVNITIECCHIGTEVSDWQPIRIAKLWPRVQNLTMRRAKGLNMKNTEAVFSMLSNLKHLGLPYWTLYRKEERNNSTRLLESFESKKISLVFERPTTDVQCLVVTNDDVWEQSENDSEHGEDEGGKFVDFEADIDIEWGNDYDSYDDYDFDDSIDDDDDHDDDENFDF